MKLAIEFVPTIAVITATGDPQAEGEELFSEAVENLLEGGDCSIVLDLAGLTTIDGHAIGDVVAAYSKASQKNAEFVLVLPRMFSEDHSLLLHSLEPLFEMYASREEAVEALVLRIAAARIEAETTRIAAQKSRRALILLRLSYVVFLISGLILFAALLK